MIVLYIKIVTAENLHTNFEEMKEDRRIPGSSPPALPPTLNSSLKKDHPSDQLRSQKVQDSSPQRPRGVFRDPFVSNCNLNGLIPKPLTPPSSQTSWNPDDVKIEHYQASPLTYMGAQRKGVRDPFPQSSSHKDHFERTLAEPFPMALDTPLPKDVSEAIAFLKRRKDESLVTFWDSQITALTKLVNDPHCSSAQWYDQRPAELANAPKSLQVGCIAQLAKFTGIGAFHWLANYSFGFPITGNISQSLTFPMTAKPDNPHPITRESLFDSAIERFKSRAVRSPQKADVLWKEATAQVELGWLDPPRPLNSSGRFADQPDLPINNAFRFAVVQGEKVRACDDLKASLTNRACSVLSPITLPSWEHLSRIASELSSAHRDLALGKGDESDAYKKQPLTPADALSAVVTLQGPDRKWYGFISRSQIFGSTAAVVHYNTFSRLLVSLFVRLFGIPMIGYFDDFGFIVFETISAKALATFESFCSLLEVSLSKKKCSVGRINSFLGIKATLPAFANKFKLFLSLDDDKSAKWVELISEFIRSRSIDHKSLDKLIGRLSFAQTNIFGKFARSLAQILYDKLHAHPYQSALGDDVVCILRWWKSTLSHPIGRIVSLKPEFPKFIIYTDAAWRPSKRSGRIAAILIERRSGRVLEVLSSPAPTRVASLFDDSSAIYGLELFALVASFIVWQEQLEGCQVAAYVDNDPASNGLVKGAAKFKVAHNFILRFWQLVCDRSIAVWFERVPSPLNLADLPTRFKKLPMKVEKVREFPHIDRLIDHFTSKWSVEKRFA